MIRDPSAMPAPRFRQPFDPVFDLAMIRATFNLRRALTLAPNDFTTLFMLKSVYEMRLMTEAKLPLLDRIVALTPVNATQRNQQEQCEQERTQIRAQLGPAAAESWANLSELASIVNRLLTSGRVEMAADTLDTRLARGGPHLGRGRPDRQPAPSPGRAREGAGALGIGTGAAEARSARGPRRLHLARRRGVRESA